MQNENNITASTASALLGTFSKTINQWSMILALATLITVRLQPKQPCLDISVMAAFLQAYFAARCAFDAALFNALGDDNKPYEQLDTILLRWRLRRRISLNRSLDERVQGALRLLRSQFICFIAQALLHIVALAYLTD